MIRRAMLVTSLVGLFLAGVARADLEEGSYAPDLEAKDWLNTEEPISLKDLRGLVVVLYFWVSFEKSGEELLKEINIIHNHRAIGRNRGVMVIGVTDANRKLIEGAIKREKATFPVALECEAYKEYDIEEFPRIVVLDPQGRVAFSGPPSQDVAQKIFDVLADNPPTRTRPDQAELVHRRLEEARNALRDRNYRHAFRAARDAFEHAVTGDPLKSVCQDMVELIDLIGRDRLAQAEVAVDDRKFRDAMSLLRSVIREFHGAEVARDAKKRLAALKKQYDEFDDLMKGQQSTIEAAKLLGAAREDLLSQRFGPATDRLEQIVKDFKDTEVAPIAEGILKRMSQNETIMAVVRDHKASRDCEMWRAQARVFMQSGRKQEAEQVLRKIISEYPNTSYAREATQMLIDLR